jgi:TPR repeat protein
VNVKKATIFFLTVLCAAFLIPEFSKAQDPDLVKKAQAGDAAAQSQLSWYYYTQKNYPTSLLWLEKSASGGRVESQRDLAGSYWSGSMGQRDHQKAIYWGTKAGQAGDANSQLNLSLWYWNADIPQDREKSIYWLPGDANSQSLWYWNADIPQDREKSIYWLRRAAESGYPDAVLALARAYRDGQYGRYLRNPSDWNARYQLVAKDNKKAKYWFQKAAARGDEVAKQELAALVGQSAAPTANGRASTAQPHQSQQQQAEQQRQQQAEQERQQQTIPANTGHRVNEQSAQTRVSPQPSPPSARPVSVPSNSSHGSMPAQETLGTWSSYNATSVSSWRDGNNNNIVTPYRQSVSVRNGRLKSWLHTDAVQPINLNLEPAEDWRNEVALSDLDPTSVSLTPSRGNVSCPMGMPPATCVYIVTEGKRNVVSYSHDGDANASFQRPALELVLPDAGTAQQAVVELAKLILKYRSFGLENVGANRQPQPYWFAYVFSDGDAPSLANGTCSSDSNYDRIAAKNCAIAICVQLTGNSFTCHEAQDVQVLQHMWAAGAQDSSGDHGFATGDRQDVATSKALSNCNPLGGCQISFVQELFPK